MPKILAVRFGKHDLPLYERLQALAALKSRTKRTTLGSLVRAYVRAGIEKDEGIEESRRRGQEYRKAPA